MIHNFAVIVIRVKPVSNFGGKLVIGSNGILNDVKELLGEGDVVKPESISIRGDELFTGDGTGKIVKVKNGKVTTLAQLKFPCRKCSN